MTRAHAVHECHACGVIWPCDVNQCLRPYAFSCRACFEDGVITRCDTPQPDIWVEEVGTFVGCACPACREFNEAR